MARKKADNSRILVTRTKVGQEEDERQREVVRDEQIAVRVFQTNPAEVSIKYGRTVQLREFESFRVDIMVSCPCYVEEVEDVYGQLKDLVGDMLFEHLNALKLSDEA